MSQNQNHESNTTKALHIIDPHKCIIEDLEILAFENEEELNYYTIWHEALVDKRRELNAESERERQIIRNEIARKKRQLIGQVGNDSPKQVASSDAVKSKSGSKRSKSSKRRAAAIETSTPLGTTNDDDHVSPIALRELRTSKTSNGTATRALSPAAARSRHVLSAASTSASKLARYRQTPGDLSISSSHLMQGVDSLPNGLSVHNSVHSLASTTNNKQIMKYRLTKLYNKYRGRQVRRNFVTEKQRTAKIEALVAKSYLNSWLTYTALQALRLPETNVNHLNAATTHGSKILTPMAQPTSVLTAQSMATPNAKKMKNLSKKGNGKAQLQAASSPQKPPMHLVYIDPGNIITYSNRINPQQIAEYRKKPPIQPSSSTSKKSSAASYDVYEIMEVLANTNKNNVTITRNANRQTQPGSSIYSHSVNANTPGIVSTQLHLQARSYLDLMSKFYAEEAQLLEKERQEMLNEPSIEEVIGRYLKI